LVDVGSRLGLARAAQKSFPFDAWRRTSSLLAQTSCFLEQSVFKSCGLLDYASLHRLLHL
jgi:hypothetical protein